MGKASLGSSLLFHSLPAKSSSRPGTLSALSASRFATYLKVENHEYFAIRPVSRPQYGR